MKYYKLDNQVFAFEADGSQDDYIKPEMVLMTESQVDEHLKAEVLPLEQTLRPLTRRQFKLALLHAGLTSQVEQLISEIPDPTEKAILEIEYNEATEFVRTSSSIKYMCNLLDLTDEEVNNLWEYALAL